jgi:prephenate dehydrogenase
VDQPAAPDVPQPGALREHDAAPGDRFRCVAIVGVGLIGGSLGMAIRRRSLADKVIGIDRGEDVLALANDLGAIDLGSDDLATVKGADCVIFATPVGCLPALLDSAARHIAPDALVTDVGSVKSRIAAAGDRLFGDRFVGGHPMAGSEASGVGSALPELFVGAPWALITHRTDGADTNPSFARIARLVRELGARPVFLTAERHDRLVALTSHLPHALSFAFAAAVAGNADCEAAVNVAGASYRDLTRVSRSSPELWADILLENRSHLLSAVAHYEASLADIRSALESGDRAALEARLRV